MSLEQMRDELAKSKRAGLECILPELSRDSLKSAFGALGLLTEGRENDVLFARILDRGGEPVG